MPMTVSMSAAIWVPGVLKSALRHRRRANWPSAVITVSWVNTTRAASFCELVSAS
jgi:hypothetical protein